MTNITHHQTNQGEETMPRLLPQLPIEIIFDILSRLPVKGLMRFKSVCKMWQSLISSDPEFAKLHLQRAMQDTTNVHRLFLTSDPFQSVDMEAYCDPDDNFLTRDHNFPVRNPEEDFEFVGSCNGLVSAIFGSECQIIVWNPSTGESRQLPRTSSADDKFFYGFGYDSKLDDYKIVQGASSATCTEVQMEFFSLKGNMWRKVQNLHCSVRLQGSVIALNGVLHWLVVCEENDGVVIVSFDLEEEKFLEMVVVPDYVTENWGTELKVLQNSLCVCSSSHTAKFEAWIVKGYGTKATWTKLFSFSSDKLPGCKYWLNVLWVAKNGDVLLNYDGLEIIIYNPEEQTSKQFDVPNDWHWFEAITYIESLVSPNAGNGAAAAADG